MTRSRAHTKSDGRLRRVAQSIVARLDLLRGRVADWRLRRRRLRDLERLFG